MEPVHDIVAMYNNDQTIKDIRRATRMSEGKIRKVLLDAGIVPGARTAEIMRLHTEGMSAAEIAGMLGISHSAVNAHLPHTKGVYSLPDAEATRNALAIRRWRKRPGKEGAQNG